MQLYQKCRKKIQILLCSSEDVIRTRLAGQKARKYNNTVHKRRQLITAHQMQRSQLFILQPLYQLFQIVGCKCSKCSRLDPVISFMKIHHITKVRRNSKSKLQTRTKA